MAVQRSLHNGLLARASQGIELLQSDIDSELANWSGNWSLNLEVTDLHVGTFW